MGHIAEIVGIIRDLAVVGALGYVIQLMRQQIALKQSEIDAHKATIEQLTKFQAPTIAR